MANFDFYSAKVTALRQRLQWLKESLSLVNPDHREISRALHDKCNYFDSEITRLERLVHHGNTGYLPRIKTNHVLLEKEMLSASNYLGIMLGEGAREHKISPLIGRVCRESEFQVRDFLVSFMTVGGPAIITGMDSLPIFYVTDESLASAYSWIPWFHEIGHVVASQNRQEIVASLVNVVRQHYRQAIVDIGPVDQNTRRQTEAALHKAGSYWIDGRNYLRLVEMFCDCFATRACGLPLLYILLDHAISFEEYPKLINPCDDHPPFLARFQACWHILPESIERSSTGGELKTLKEDYELTASPQTNPELEYGTVCPSTLIHELAMTSVRLIQRIWPSLKAWSNPPPPHPENIKTDEPLASILNKLLFTLMHDYGKYPDLERGLVQAMLEK